MRKVCSVLVAALCAAVLLFAGCADKNPPSPTYPEYTPEYVDGDGDFGFDSNAFSADVTLDGKLDDARWQEADVVALGTWDNTDVDNGEYGAIVNNTANYATTKRAIIRMFRGTVGLHFGFEVRDADVTYLRQADGDDAIWSDNILLNLCTAIDGGTVPMSDDYYFLVTAFGNTCFRRGANAAGMWGAWSGVLDYEASLTYETDETTGALVLDETTHEPIVTGFGVELVVPYAQVGLSKDSPVGVTFRSCDRVSAQNDMYEREWYYKGGAHEFNTPNGYIIWGEDNELYSYYDYAMPNVTVQGVLSDYVSGEPLADVQVGGVTTDANGAFTLQNVNANVDLTLTAHGDSLLGDQSFTISRDKMRVLKGGTLSVGEKLLTKANTVTQTIRGVVTSAGSLTGATVRVGDTVTNVAADGSYSLQYTFNAAVATMQVQATGSDVAFVKEIPVSRALSGAIVEDIELPVMTLLPDAFGASGNARAYLGWTRDGLFVRVTNKGTTNGFGVAYSVDGQSGNVALYHALGTMCVTDFVSQSWAYVAPESLGVDAYQETLSDGTAVYTFVIPYGAHGIPQNASDLKIAPFECRPDYSFAWYADENDVSYPFGNIETLAKYPTLAANGEVTFVPPPPPLTVESAYDITTFGKSEAVAKFEKVSGAQNGIRVTITYTAGRSGFFGFGVIFYDAVAAKGITQLFAPSFGTVQHRAYGDWAWSGDSYVAPATVGVEQSITTKDGKTVLTLFYDFDTFAWADYGLDITATSQQIRVQMFEYVDDASGNLYACYNTISNASGDPLAFDNPANMIVWNTAA